MIDRVLNISSEKEFCEIAMEVFRYQSLHCAPYREYIQLIDCGEVDCVEKIPFMQIGRAHV